MATAAAKAPEAAGDAPKKSKLLLIIILLVVLLAGGGGAAWFFLMRGHADDEEHETQAAAKPAVFLPLDQFTVNLQAEEGQQFLQVAMTLKVVDQAVAEAIKAAMPEVRSRVLLLLSSKKPSQLSTLDGKNKLAEEVIHEVEQTMPGEKKKKKKKKKKAKAEESAEHADAKGGKEAAADAKEGKSKKSKAKDEDEEDEAEDLPERVLAVFFTHFIVQ